MRFSPTPLAVTETHELVGHDTDPYDLARTTILLTTLGEWCSRIPSRRLLIVLDCCFSGGMGANALQVEAVPRDIQSVDGKLNQISGEGRVVLTVLDFARDRKGCRPSRTGGYSSARCAGPGPRVTFCAKGGQLVRK
jgi:hypothetical protein